MPRRAEPNSHAGPTREPAGAPTAMTVSEQHKANWATWTSVAALTLAGLALRVYDLGDLPGGFYCDEAANGYNAHQLFSEGVDEHGKPYPLFVWSFLAFKYPFYIYPTAIWTGLFGLSEFTTRFQAALYGAATIPVAFAIARTFSGTAGGIAAAAVITILPWHHHFGRIAFSLSGLPFWFGLGFLFLARALGEHARRSDWIAAGVFLAVTPYVYAPGQLVVAPLVVIAVLLHLDVVWRRRGWAALGAIAGLLVCLPFLYFFWSNLELQTRYAEMISVFTPNRTTAEAFERIRSNYLLHYSTRFLFERGDPVIRHGVRTAGELYWAIAPWIAIGALGSLLMPNRRSKLLLVWLAIYPFGAILIREAPSATRAVTGALLFPVLAGVGFGYFVRLCQRFGSKALTAVAIVLACGATLRFLVPEAIAYGREYYTAYPTYSAAGLYGFQYGWRDLFSYMEPRRPEVDELRVSTTDLNQGYIFRLFYLDRTPEEIQRWGEPRRDYKFVQPRVISSWYNPRRRLLFAVQEIDMWVFDSWDEKHDIIAPGGHVAFHVLRNPKPKQFLSKWRAIGPFPNPNNQEREHDFIDPVANSSDAAASAGSDWFEVPSTDGFLQLNALVGNRMDPPTRNAEFAIVYLHSVVDAAGGPAALEIYGSGDEIVAWVNGERVIHERTIITPTEPAEVPIRLRPGSNTILLKTIETVGDWWVAARVKPSER